MSEGVASRIALGCHDQRCFPLGHSASFCLGFGQHPAGEIGSSLYLKGVDTGISFAHP
jgi:hypothetical protein